MIEWIQSTEVFRAWAEDWVLRPCDEAVFRLPIRDHFLFVSVSPTLGVVRHSWFSRNSVIVYGCVGHHRFMLNWRLTGSSATKHTIVEVGCDGAEPRPVGTVDAPCIQLYCNRKWTVGFHNSREMCVWRVVDGDVVQPGCILELNFAKSLMPHCKEMSSMLHFSPFNDDVVVVSSRIPSRADTSILSFCDLEAGTNQGNLVVSSKVICGHTESVLWTPDCSMCTLHFEYSMNAYFAVNSATNKRVVDFPQFAAVIPVGTMHVFVRADNQFQVFNTGNMKSKPTICVPCTWAAPSKSTRKSCLIASTSYQHPVNDKGSKEITFSVHEGDTGFHVGDFTVPFDSSLFFFNPKVL